MEIILSFESITQRYLFCCLKKNKQYFISILIFLYVYLLKQKIIIDLKNEQFINNVLVLELFRSLNILSGIM